MIITTRPGRGQASPIDGLDAGVRTTILVKPVRRGRLLAPHACRAESAPPAGISRRAEKCFADAHPPGRGQTGAVPAPGFVRLSKRETASWGASDPGVEPGSP